MAGDQFVVYILQSERSGRFYIGFSGDVASRLASHNDGAVKSTRHLRPWKLVYMEPHSDATAARRREYALKAMKSHIYSESLIRSAG